MKESQKEWLVLASGAVMERVSAKQEGYLVHSRELSYRLLSVNRTRCIVVKGKYSVWLQKIERNSCGMEQYKYDKTKELKNLHFNFNLY